MEFKRIEITDRARAVELLARSGFRGCEYTFGNNFVWRNFYNVEIAFEEDFYFCRFGKEGDYKFSFPAGRKPSARREPFAGRSPLSDGDVKRAVELLKGYCGEKGIKLVISANKEITERLLELYPDSKAEYSRDTSDYIYLAEDLAELKGKKYHAKRNHLNRFYENNWSYEPLTADNMAECIEMNDRWCEENLGCDVVSEEDRSKRDEECIVRCSFKYFNKLEYIGGVLRVDGKVQAFTFGEPSAEDCFVVHVEKALRDYQGAYAAINREFVKSLGGRYKYINREDDTGAENLRKAKLSYYPVFLEEKSYVEIRG
ncbi:MAG: phosphatidylglycerol lysyltransferase domain-containing protein [Oscillospiraceae bacterium]|nr:phosphatidylglycerol lysyltransferase domain-containing protein [Oscillospiraceae bacterium]